MQPEKSVCVCNSHFWYTYISKDCGNIVSHLRDLSSVFFFSQGHFCCSSGNCNAFRFNEPGFLPSECILRCSNLATEQWRVARGWNGKGPPKNQGSKIHVHPLIWGAKWRFQNLQKSVPRYFTSGAEDGKFGFQDAFNPFYASRFSTFAHAFVPFQTSHGYPVRWVFFGCFGRGMDPQCAYATTYATGYCNLASCTVHRKCPLVRFRTDRRYEFYILHALYFSRLIFFWKSPQPTSTHSHQTLFGETAKKGDHQMVLILGKSKNANGYGKFEGCPP